VSEMDVNIQCRNQVGELCPYINFIRNVLVLKHRDRLALQAVALFGRYPLSRVVSRHYTRIKPNASPSLRRT